jgi:hypothetical protein
MSDYSKPLPALDPNPPDFRPYEEGRTAEQEAIKSSYGDNPMQVWVSPVGTKMLFSSDRASALAAHGWIPEGNGTGTSFNADQLRNQDWNTPAGQVVTGALGALTTTTLGLAPGALAKTGAMTKEEQDQANSTNPYTGMLGQAAGLANPYNFAGKTGEAVAGAVAGKVAPGLLGSIAKMGARGAVENTMYGAGGDISEALLGNPDITAQSMLYHGGVNALLGGVIGGGLGAVGHVLGSLGGKLESLSSKTDSSINKLNESVRDPITEQVPRSGEVAPRVNALLEKPDLAAPYLKALDPAAESTERLLQHTYDRSLSLERVTLDAIPIEGPRTASGRVVAALEALQDPDILSAMPKGTASELIRANKGIIEAIGSSASTSDLRQALVAQSDAIRSMPESAVRRDAIGAIDSGLKDSAWGESGTRLYDQESSLRNISNAREALSGVTPENASARSGAVVAAHEAVLDARQAVSAAEADMPVEDRGLADRIASSVENRGIHRATHHLSREILQAGATAAGFHLGGPLGGMAVYAGSKVLGAGVHAILRLGETNGAMAKVIDASASSLARGITQTISAGVAKSFAKSPEDNAKSYLKLTDKIKDMASNPTKLQAALSDHIGDLAQHAPQTSMALAADHTRTLQYLNAQIPPRPRSLMQPDYVPSRNEVSKFTRIYDAANDPMSVMKSATEHKLTPDQVDSLRNCHPDLYSVMSQSVMHQAQQHKKDMTYQDRTMAAMFLGHDIDGTIHPQVIPPPQSAQQGAPGQAGGTTKPSVNGLSKITLASRMSTDQDSIDYRDKKKG